MLLRRTSVGCAVSTGTISAWSSKAGDRVLVDALARQPVERLGDGRAGLGRDALPVLGEVGEHGEQHEAAHEGERVVEAQRVEARIDRVRRDDAAMPVDRGRADIFDPLGTGRRRHRRG